MNATNWIVVCTATVLSLTVTASAQQTNAQTGANKIQQTRLGPMDAEVMNPVFSRDACHLAYVTTKGEKQCVVVDGQAGTEYDGISEGSLIFSADGKRLAYIAKKGAKWLIVLDGQASAEYDGIAKGSLIFSPDGKRLAYIAKKGAKWLVVMDGQAGAEYDGIAEGTPIFSPDGVLEYLAIKDDSLYRVKHIPAQ